MSHKLISHSPDLKKLRDEGFEVEVKGAHLMVHGVPYVNSKKEIARGTLVSTLNLAADKTVKPETHVIYFVGDHPCDKNGSPIKGISHTSQNQTLGAGVVINHSFSSKLPDRGYDNYYEKVTTYIRILSSQAESLDPSVTARTFKAIESHDSDSAFRYLDTNSSRADITTMSARLEGLRVAIVGLGGTGSYVLDYVAKTAVKEIHLFDGDPFLQHNAFRAPGAPAFGKLEQQPKKVAYLHDIYAQMHKFTIPHEYKLTSSNLGELAGMDFVFLCIDDSESKKLIIESLTANKTSFIDVGIGVQVVDTALTGSIRVTTCTASKNDHVASRISFSDREGNDYAKNIQIAELNALSAALAVIKWKKLYGVYHDLEKEHNAIYELNTNRIINDENVSKPVS